MSINPVIAAFKVLAWVKNPGYGIQNDFDIEHN